MSGNSKNAESLTLIGGIECVIIIIKSKSMYISSFGHDKLLMIVPLPMTPSLAWSLGVVILDYCFVGDMDFYVMCPL